MSLLAPIQLGAAVILVCFFQIYCLGGPLSSFLPRSTQNHQGDQECGWLVWTILIPTYSMQYVCLAVAG